MSTVISSSGKYTIKPELTGVEKAIEFVRKIKSGELLLAEPWQLLSFKVEVHYLLCKTLIKNGVVQYEDKYSREETDEVVKFLQQFDLKTGPMSHCLEVS